MDKLFDRLQMLEDRYEELGELLSDPDVISDTKRFTKLSKEMADLRETVEKYNKYKGDVNERNRGRDSNPQCPLRHPDFR